jgi:hypothetical protein
VGCPSRITFPLNPPRRHVLRCDPHPRFLNILPLRISAFLGFSSGSHGDQSHPLIHTGTERSGLLRLKGRHTLFYTCLASQIGGNAGCLVIARVSGPLRDIEQPRTTTHFQAASFLSFSGVCLGYTAPSIAGIFCHDLLVLHLGCGRSITSQYACSQKSAYLNWKRWKPVVIRDGHDDK